MEVIDPVRANHQTFLRMAYIPPNKENTDNIAKGIAMPIRRDETNSGISSVPGKKKPPVIMKAIIRPATAINPTTPEIMFKIPATVGFQVCSIYSTPECIYNNRLHHNIL